jgi:hypothetical protein
MITQKSTDDGTINILSSQEKSDDGESQNYIPPLIGLGEG